jgi:hypothetical protein
LPSPDELASYVAARSEKHSPGEHWSNFVGLWRHGSKARRELALFEFCRPYEIIELWFDPAPDDQLQLICWLDWFKSYPEISAKLKLRLIDFNLIMMDGSYPARQRHRSAYRNRELVLAGISGADAGTLLRSASPGFERISIAETGPA